MLEGSYTGRHVGLGCFPLRSVIAKSLVYLQLEASILGHLPFPSLTREISLWIVLNDKLGLSL